MGYLIEHLARHGISEIMVKVSTTLNRCVDVIDNIPHVDEDGYFMLKQLDETERLVRVIGQSTGVLFEVISSTLHNAIRHTLLGGRRDVQLRATEAWATLEVIDTGGGISAELRPRLFHPFSTAAQRHGSGLGLTIAREMVVALGGTIALNNRTESDGRMSGLSACAMLPRVVEA